jgi:alkylation response protein AidB-like acyl-CoA dehydrogenase
MSETCSNYAVPIALTPDQLALQAAIRDWAKQAAPLAAVRRLEPGLPAGLADLGVFSIAIPEAAGGAGGTLTDLAAALEQLAIALVPGPVLPTTPTCTCAAPWPCEPSWAAPPPGAPAWPLWPPRAPAGT